MEEKCGCYSKVFVETNAEKIETFRVDVFYCPTHAAAPLTLEACKSACDFIEKMISTWDEFDDEYLGDEDRAMLDGLRAAIAAAGKKVE